MHIREYNEKLTEISSLKIIPVSEIIWIKNLELSWEHKDPADRTIVATALLTDSQIVTSDEVITNFYPQIYWI